MTNRVKAVGTFDDKISGPLDRVRDKFDRLQKQGAKGIAIGAGAEITRRGLDMIGSALAGVGDQIDMAIKASSDLNEQMSKSEVVFGSASDEIQAFADKAAASFGLSKRAALEAAGGFGQFFTGAGQSQAAAEDMSERLVALGADLASFNNLDPTETLDKLRAGLAGEAEPLRRVGVFLTEAKVKAKAMQMGLGGAHGELTEGEKILARYQIILDETKNAQGDFARTSDGLANSQRRTNAELEDARAELGKALVPLATQWEREQVMLLNFATSGLEGWKMLGDVINDTAGKEREAAKEALALATAEDNVRRAGGRLNAEARTLAGNIDDVGDESSDTASDVAAMRLSLGRAEAAAKGLDDAMADLTDTLFGGTIRTGELAEAKADLDELLRNGPESKSASDLAIWKGQVAAARLAIFDLQVQMAQEAGPEAFRKFLLEQKRILSEELNPQLARELDLLLQINAAQISTSDGGKRAGGGASSGGGGSTPTTTTTTTAPVGGGGNGGLLAFDEGGIVPGPRGAPRVILAHGGEMVVPEDESPAWLRRGSSLGGGSGQLIEVHSHLYLDGRQIAEAVTRDQYYRQSGPSRYPRG